MIACVMYSVLSHHFRSRRTHSLKTAVRLNVTAYGLFSLQGACENVNDLYNLIFFLILDRVTVLLAGLVDKPHPHPWDAY